jgi:aspartyl-tRNA(Asn)/glutamyl-tRNA(Gln) amidotransferase subunit C
MDTFGEVDSAMKITHEGVLRVAELAHLGLSPEEVETYRAHLEGILTYVDKLQELDITNVAPMSQVLYAAGNDGEPNSHPELRDDVPRPCDVAEATLAGAPDATKRFFRVPKVIDR